MKKLLLALALMLAVSLPLASCGAKEEKEYTPNAVPDMITDRAVEGRDYTIDDVRVAVADFKAQNGQITYMSYDESKVIYVKKDYSSKDLLIVSGYEANENGEVIVYTTKGKIVITGNEVYFNGLLYQTSRLPYIIEDTSLPMPMYYFKTSTHQAFEIYSDLMYSSYAKYSSIGIIGNYVLTDDTILAANTNNYGLITKGVTLSNGYRYNVQVYSKDNFTADVVIIDDPNATTLIKNVSLVVSYCDESTIHGYVDGEEKSISVNNSTLDIRPGDYISISLINDIPTGSITVLASPRNNIQTCTTYANHPNPTHTDLIVCAPADNIVNNFLYTTVFETAYLNKITADTDFYVFDLNQNTVIPGDITDIRIFTYYGYSADWVVVHSSAQTANTILICKQ